MKTINAVLFSVLLSFALINLKAQQTSGADSKSSVRGILTEEVDTIPVGFANIALYKQSDSTLVTWTLAKEDGSFELTKVPVGTFKLVTDFIGYKRFILNNISVTKTGDLIDLGKLKLEYEATALGEVTVVGVRKTSDSKIDRKVIDVSRDINSTGGTAVDLLRNVPNLTVDANGAVSLRGNSDVSILIDGRPTSIDAAKLDQISASEVESVEIITNPTAKYNPEGKSGIINLKLKQKKTEGFYGNAMLTMGTWNKYTTGLSLNYNKGKFNVFVSYMGVSKKTQSERYLLRESYNSDTAHYLEQNADTKLDINLNKFSLGTKMSINPQNSLTVSFTQNYTDKVDADGTLSEYFDRSMNLTGSVFTDNSENSKGSSQDYLLGYRKTFDKKDEELTIDYTYSTSLEDQNQPMVFNYPDYSASTEIFNHSAYHNSDLQLNWVLPLSNNSKLESGIQSIIRGTNNDYYQNILESDSWVEDTNSSNNFAYNEQIYSAYSMYSGKKEAFSYIAGLRLEQSLIDGHQTVNSEKISQQYFNFYPSVNLMYSPDQKNEFQLSYNRRINRPTARMINPFIDMSSPDVYRSGNPNLKPEYVNSFEAGYNRIWNKANVGFTLFYKDITDLINPVSSLDSNGISHIAPQNIAKSRNLGFEFTYDQLLLSWWKLTGNGSFYRNAIESDDKSISHSDYSYNARLNNVFTPLSKTSFQLVMNYTGPIIAITSKMEPQFSIDMAVKRDFLDNKISLTARVTDLLNTLKNSYTAWGDNFYAENWRKTETRVVYFSIAYNFGSQSKKTKSNGNLESTHSTEIF
jgi:outer membrane receptor protein involved in Fe transport